MSSEEESPDLQIVKRHVAELGEHFDTVQVFVTRLKDEGERGTINVHYGSGDWFARFGFVTYWKLKQEEIGRIEAQRDNGEA